MSLEDLFLKAVELAPADRPAFLDQACAGEPDSRAAVEGLLRAHEAAGSVLEQPLFQAGPTATYAPPAEAAGAVIDRYKLVERIGEGGMGEVWLAHQTDPVKRLVALKVIKAGMDTKAVLARFEAERQALALMDHPNIAKVLDGGATPGGRPYFVMELVKGTPITAYCDEHRLTPRQRLELFIPVCQAVQHAHQKGIIHRDLKPSNVLVAPYDGKPVVKVIDFGVAKAAGVPLTEKTLVTGFGAVVGTPEYMSPEQAELNNQDIDTRSDVYSLGILLYELLTGSTPLTRQRAKEAALFEVLRLVREEEPPPPSTRLSSTAELPNIAAVRGVEPARLSKLVRGELDWIVMKALEKDRNRRYESVNGFALDVQRYLCDEPVAAGPPSASYRLRKFVRRNRGRVILVGLLLAALLIGAAGMTLGLIRSRQSEAKASSEKENAERSRELADQNFRMARKAVEDYSKKVANDPRLKWNAGLHALRKELLAGALPFYEEFVRQKTEDPSVRFDQGTAYHQLGFLRDEMGELEDALNNYTKASEILADLTAADPTTPTYRFALARALNNRAHVLFELGRHDAALATFRETLGHRAKLRADFPDDPKYRFELAQSHHNVGLALAQSGKGEKALEEFRQASDLLEKLVAEFPREADYLHNLTDCNNARGLTLVRLRRIGEAETAFRDAAALKARLVAAFARVPEYRQELASARNNLGNVLADSGQAEKAEAAYRSALAARAELAADFPDVPVYRQQLSTALSNLGHLLVQQGNWNGAEALFRRALGLQEKLAADSPTVPAYQIDLAGTHLNFGDLVRDRGQPEAALEWYAKAISRLEAVLAKDDRLAGARDYLRNTFWGRAIALSRLKRDTKALADCDRALQLDDGEKRDFLRGLRAELLVNVGEYAKAVADADELAKVGDLPGVLLYNLACAYARSSAGVTDGKLKDAYGTKAVDLLRRAQAAGVFRAATDVEGMKADADLASIRKRDDYQKLVRELEAAVKPAPKAGPAK